MRTRQSYAAIVVAGAWIGLLAGCGTPGAPQPPSLNLPDRVNDLTAVRAGNQVSLAFTMPRRNTDKLRLKNSVAVHICRREGAGDCVAAGDLQLEPAARGSFAETLPAALAGGAPRALSFFVELRNRNGRSAGVSNAATILAGEAPAPIVGLAAEIRRDGIVLRWTPDNSSAAIRLQRKLLTPPSPKPRTGPLPATPEPVEQNLFVETGMAAPLQQALDKNIVLGNLYEYRAQRVLRVSSDGQTLELSGEFSAPIRVAAQDIFPPAVPVGLDAVATVPDSANGAGASIDLSWQPNTEADLAGYKVYRREETAPWQRISGEQPVIGPSFHDTSVVSGHTYRYAVSAVDKAGHESGRSMETSETVPNP
jgi:hypothetical protein